MAAHLIVWSGIEAMRGTSGLVAAMDEVESLLNGAINDRGCAIGTLETATVVVVVPKVRSEIRECQDIASQSSTPRQVSTLHTAQHVFFNFNSFQLCLCQFDRFIIELSC